MDFERPPDRISHDCNVEREQRDDVENFLLTSKDI